jgi:phosphoribosylaminoimidazolecarboxamide formyltransferase/IMP cyclohydrolase
MPRVKRALISVSDKADIVWLARELEAMGVEMISTGGTYKLLSQEKIEVTPVAEVTGFPEMLDGRVKTLHPKVHGGILADRDKPEHLRQLDFQKIGAIDLVVVNLYPFAQTVARPGVTREEAIENIDIGGPTMVRAAAKNHAHVAIVVNPARYSAIIEELKGSSGVISPETCRELAREAFAHTAEYDAMISSYLEAEAGRGPGAQDARLALSFEKVSDLRYGENPHQSASLYADRQTGGQSLATAGQVAGPALSFNNILDGEAAWQCVLEFDQPACVIIKHNNPCGAAVSDYRPTAYQKAYDCDPVSAFGSVIAFNGTVCSRCAEAMKDNFIELLLAPEFQPDALEILSAKKDLRIMEMGEIDREYRGKDMRRIHGGLLVQEYDVDPYDRSGWKVVTKKTPTDAQWEDLIFAWKVAKHVKSNAIVLARGGATVGVGAGQMSRVDSAMIAVEKAGGRAAGCSVASDAFFPFPDAVEKVISAGAEAIIQPGGSKRDDDALAACERHGVAMVFTGMRHFRH